MVNKSTAPEPSEPALPVSKLPDASTLGGEMVSVACNLPHGLHPQFKGYQKLFAGANQKRAIDTDTGLHGKWGLTHNVPKDWFEAWVKEVNHPAVANGLIMIAPRDKIEDMAEQVADGVSTGAEQLDPESKEFKAQNGVETTEPED